MDSENFKTTSHQARRFLTAYLVLIAGLLITLVVASFSDKAGAPYTLGVGIIISLLLFGVAHLQNRARIAVERSADKLKLSEATLRTTLEERERAEAAVKESEER